MADFVDLGFELAFKYRNPAVILSDGVIGQMMEKVVLPPQKQRLTDDELEERYGSWATTGRKGGRERNIMTSLELKSERQEAHNHHLQAKYKEITENEVRYEAINCENAEYLLVAYGSSARISQKVIDMASEKGIKVGLIRPITLWPFPSKIINKLADQVKGILSVEMSAGQMVEDVRLAVNGKVKVEHFGRYGGMIPSPNEVLEALETKIIKG
jgi:2-oxoglutarate ferredoxin oxidoreductase subunit alpha